MLNCDTPIYFCCDASYAIGCGHLMRCLSLANAFRGLEAMQPVLITANMDRNFIKYIEHAGCTHIILNKNADKDDNLSEVISIIKRNRCKSVPICVIDSYDIKGDHEKKLKEEGIFVVVIDDMCARSFHSDIVINYHLGAKTRSYKHAPYTRFLLGTSYVPLRSDFVDIPSARKFSNVENNILVTLGGGSLANRIVRDTIIESLCILKNKTDVNVVVVASLSKEDKKAVMRKARSSGFKLNILSNVMNMSELMLESDLAIAAGGVTAYELAACGLPSLLFILGENQEGIAGSFAGAGVSINLGWHETVLPIKLAKEICDLISNSARRREMSDIGQELVDGKGCKRIVEEVLQYS